MSCGCNTFDADNPNSNTSCGPCNPCTSESAECETLPSALDNFTSHFFGTVSKTLINGKVSWTLPCNLNVGLPDNPRNEGEGLACYFLRLFGEGIIGLTGPRGPKGDAGTDGVSGYTYTSTALTIPPSTCPVAQVDVQDPDAIPVGVYIFIAGAGWFAVVSRTGSTLQLQLIEAVAASGTVIAVGALVGLTGPTGPQGIRGPQGVKGDKGNTGATGPAGADGDDGAAALTTTQASYTQPAVGSTVVVTVLDSSFFTGGMQVYVIGGGYYTIAAVAPGSLTLRNLGIAATNAAPAATVSSGAKVVVAGASPVVAAAEVVGQAASDPSITNSAAEVTFTTTALSITLPAAGTYLVVCTMTVDTGASAPNEILFQLYDQTNAVTIGRYMLMLCGGHANRAISQCWTQRITVLAATEIRVWANTDTNTADATSGQCALDAMLVNPTT